MGPWGGGRWGGGGIGDLAGQWDGRMHWRFSGAAGLGCIGDLVWLRVERRQ